MSVGVMKDYKLSKTKEFTRLTYTGLVVELEHLKIDWETRSIDEKFASAMGEYVTERW